MSGINHGSNLGDDITYSGTVAAALRASCSACRRSRSPSSRDARRDGLPPRRASFDFDVAAAFTARVVEELEDVPMPAGTLLNINVPGRCSPRASRSTRLGKRIYRDALTLRGGGLGRRRYRIYGDDPGYHDEDGTDLAAIAEGRIAVTPIHFDLTDQAGVEALAGLRPRPPARARRREEVE